MANANAAKLAKDIVEDLSGGYQYCGGSGRLDSPRGGIS